jgi:DNA-binding MarR family transcriptional regulator
VSDESLARDDYPSRYPSADEESIEINRLLRATHTSVADAFRRCLVAGDFWGPYSRYHILRNLEFADGELPQSELSRMMDVTSGNLSRLLDSLEKEGLIARRSNPQDKRFTFIALTPAGQDLCARLMPEVGAMASQMLEGFTSTEKHTFLELLGRFKRNADSVYRGARTSANQAPS